MDGFYRDGSRSLQDRWDTRRLADRLAGTIVHAALTPHDREFIQRMDMFFLATVDGRGCANCSYKGGAPGFVRVLDEVTLAFPSYDGNGMQLSLGGMLETQQVGLLFIDFEQRRRLRVNGEAVVDVSDALLSDFCEAQCVVRVRIREVFPNCSRYIHKMQRVEASRFVPQVGLATPVPTWKRTALAQDVLPDGDPARDAAREVLDE